MNATRVRKVEAALYQESVDAVLGSLGTDVQRGLSATEARTRLDQLGPNALTAKKPAPAWKKFITQFKDVLVILLLTATAISAALWLVEHETALPYEAIAILSVVLLNAIMGYIQESRAESGIAALRTMAAAHAIVMREGTPRSVPASEIVPGDLILMAVIYLPFLENAFSTVSLSWSDWLMCFAVASSVLWIRELRKCITRITRATARSSSKWEMTGERGEFS